MLHKIITLLIFLSVLTFTETLAQKMGEIVGKVVDDSTGIALENTNVFISQTTLGTNTNQHGKFEIKNIPEGDYDIIASRVGYVVHKQRITVTQKSVSLTIRLKASTVALEEVTISAEKPEFWQKQLERFTKFFLGNSANAKECKIVNPEILEFTEEADYLSATTREPLIIENYSLGYRIEYLLRVFSIKPVTADLRSTVGKGYSIVYDGFPKFTPLQSQSLEQKNLWKKNRSETYNGSLSHLLSSLYNGMWEKEGFVINVVPEIDLTNSPLYRTVITKDVSSEIVSPAKTNDEKILHFDGFLEVEYKRKSLDAQTDVLRKKGTNSPVSWMQLNYTEITFNAQGLIKETMPTNLYGYWSNLRFSDMLPLDYVPE